MSRKNLQNVSSVIDRLLEWYNVTETQLAEKLGITQPAISNWRRRNTMDYGLVITKCEGVSLDWLFRGEGVHSNDPGESNVNQVILVHEPRHVYENDSCVKCRKELQELRNALKVLGRFMQQEKEVAS